MERPKVMWIDMTITTRHGEVDARFNDYFDIRYGSVPSRLDFQLELENGEAIFFEFDYPDQPGLSILRNTKQRFPGTPILMLTTQHSEQLAVWAYRNRVLDYLVTPVSQEDLIRARQTLLAIYGQDKRQDERAILGGESKIPIEVPVGQRVRSVRLEAALNFVQTHFRRKMRIAEVADLCGMSQFHFSHEFADTFSLTFQEFVLRYRIFEACKELRHPNVAVANVAYSVGFNDPSYFARVFRRFVGISPSEYSLQTGGSQREEALREVLEKLELPALDSTREFHGADHRARMPNMYGSRAQHVLKL